MNDFQNDSNLFNIQRGKPRRKDQSKSNSHSNQQNEPRPSYLRNFQQKSRVQRQQIQMIFHEADSSMEKILNSSMSQLDKVIQGLDEPEKRLSVQDLVKQNSQLKSSLVKMKKILKQKLQAGLGKQRQELSKILEDYISLITKLLQDKEQLTNRLSEKDGQQKEREQQLINKYEMMKETNNKMKKALEERDAQLTTAKEKTNQFLVIIQQYEEQTVKQQSKFEQMKERIQQLQEKLAEKTSNNRFKNTQTLDSQHSFGYQEQRTQKYEAQQTKIQTLIQLLESSQQENCKLRQQLTMVARSREDIKQQYEAILSQLRKQNQQEFIEYERAVKETLDKKDDCIQRLNLIIQNLRSKKNT